ncbi:MAG: hypothetical protein KDA37_05495, partial [Planctomycetales bacterium]|nr:hypothetical protein [Planctomycetales bacterium]
RVLSNDQQAKLDKLIQQSGNPLYDPVDAILSEPGKASSAPPAKEQSPASEMSATQPDEDAEVVPDNSEGEAQAEPPSGPPVAFPEDGAQPSSNAEDGGELLSFNFRFQPWEDVLEWFADKSDLSLILDAPPSGTFNYRDNRQYTVGQAMDVLNNVLQTKGFTLVRKGRMLLLVNLEDELPPNLVSDVPLEELDQHGEHELVRVLFRVRSMLPEDLAEELERLIGPQGKIIVLSKANMIQVTETAGRIRTIRRVIESIDGPGEGDIREIPLRHVMVDEALPIIRQMLGIPSDALATPAGTLQLAVDPLGGKVFARGDAKEMARLDEVIKLVDVEGSALGGASVVESPQLEVYSTGGADPELVLKVLQTMLADAPGARLAADTVTGNIVALARPSDHATIRATLAQMQQDVRKVEVIPLDKVDPSVAKLAVDKLFNRGTAETPDPRAPIVEADLKSYSLIVRATPPQILEIKGLLDQLGESGAGSLAGGAAGNVRVLPLTGSAARSALAQVQQIWPMLRQNKIRVVTPSAASIQEYRPSQEDAGPLDRSSAEPTDDERMQELMDWLEQSPGAQPRPQQREAPPQDPSASTKHDSPFRFVSQPLPADGETIELKSESGSTIIVAAGPGGLLIASEDTEALDEFEDLLRSTAGQSTSSRQFAVFYLKYAEATSAAEILSGVFGASGGGSLGGDIASGMLNEMGGGMMGDILGLGLGGSSSSFGSTSVDIVPDLRLNALIVYATPQDLDMVEQLLRIVDQRTGPAAVEAGGRPRLIPVVNSSATAILEVVKQVYADRITGSGGGGGGQPDPRELMRMLQRGARGAMGGGGSATDQEPSKMSLGVDARSNSIIVRAPDPLFDEVELLVKKLDEEGLETPQATRIVSLRNTNMSAVKEALQSILGSESVTSKTTTTPQQANNSGNNNQGNPNNRDAAEAFRRRIEFFRQMQEQATRGGRGGRGGGGDRGSRGGGGDRGGRGRGG